MRATGKTLRGRAYFGHDEMTLMRDKTTTYIVWLNLRSDLTSEAVVASELLKGPKISNIICT